MALHRLLEGSEMMKMVVAVALVALAPQIASACTLPTGSEPDLNKILAENPIVFVGEVIQAPKQPSFHGGEPIKFKVLHKIRGVSGDTFETKQGMGGMCQNIF